MTQLRFFPASYRSAKVLHTKITQLTFLTPPSSDAKMLQNYMLAEIHHFMQLFCPLRVDTFQPVGVPLKKKGKEKNARHKKNLPLHFLHWPSIRLLHPVLFFSLDEFSSFSFIFRRSTRSCARITSSATRRPATAGGWARSWSVPLTTCGATTPERVWINRKVSTTREERHGHVEKR